MDMTFQELFDLIKTVVLSKEVIGATVVVLLILNMVFYIVSYRKRPARRKNKRGKGKTLASASASSVTSDSSSPQEEDAYV